MIRRWAITVAAGLLSASCAAVWGFDDATLRPDASDDATLRPGASVDASDEASRDAESDVIPDAPLASEADSRPTMSDAIVAPVDAGHDAAADRAAPPEAATPPSCSPACSVGGTCANAVGGVSVCVTSNTCTNSADCFPNGCCVWLTFDSGTGRCEAFAPGAPAPEKARCLCTSKETGPGHGACNTCAKPAADPGANVMVCGS